MPFMKGPSPVRNSFKYLENKKLILKPYVRIFSVNYHLNLNNHKGASEFVFWHLGQLQYVNPGVQCITFKNLTPTPFIRVWFDNKKELLLDVDRESRGAIYDRVVSSLCLDEEETKQVNEEVENWNNPAHFGYGCPRHCMCEIPGQIPCPELVPLPYTWRGKFKRHKKELDESYFL